MKNLIQKIPILRELQRRWRRYRFNKKWKQLNRHNYTSIGDRMFPIENVTVGAHSYGALNVQSLYVQAGESLNIGNFVSIAPGAQFLLGGNHPIDGLSTYPLYSRFIQYHPKDAQTKGPIIVEDEVWIGTNALIMSGVTIGKGAVIAAGAVVTKEVPAYAIVGGNPAKVIKFRFEEALREELMGIHLMDLQIDVIKENIDLFYGSIENQDQLAKIKLLLATQHP